MAYYDPQAYWLMARLLALFDPQPGDASLSYEGLLWRLQALNSRPAYPQAMPQAKPLPEPTTDPEEQALREALAYFAPQPEDRYRDKATIALRMLRVVDRELQKWSSGLVQERSPTGAAVLPVTPLEVEP